MKINAICMVKNEADIIIEALANALNFCHRIYVFDNGSTDGTSELIDEFIKSNPRVVLAQRSDELFKNQLRNRVYNMFHQLYSDDDWWYILDADELVAEDPRPYLEKAAKSGADCMRTWQAQFYLTEKDLEQFDYEDMSKPVTERRRYYRINWREPRFFKNKQDVSWPETISGRIPPFCGKFYYRSPICCHYAQRDPEQIRQRVQIRVDNPYSFFHLKKGDASAHARWLKSSKDLFFYQNDGNFCFPLRDKVVYFAREFGYWCQWRAKGVVSRTKRLLALS